MDMFENYDYIPGTYIPCNPCPPKVDFTQLRKPLTYYNAADEFLGYAWNYGDSIVLEFTTTGDVQYNEEGTWEDAATYLKGKKMHLDIRDFRYEVVYDATVDANTVVKFLIDETSSARLVKGVYTFQLTLIDEEAETQYVLMPGVNETCSLYIK